MFFSLANSLVIFQTIMDKILQDLINTREVISFIDNVIVGIEEKKEYNEVVEEVVKRLVENDLYLKLEKYKWKVMKIEFLKVVIRLDEIKMEKEKLKIVLDLPIPKSIKEVQKFL